MRTSLGAVGVAAVIAGLGGAAIAAAAGGGHSFPDGGMHGPGGGMHGSGGPPPASAARASASEPESLHGEYVVANGSGGFTTKLSQKGTVTAISATSVTARSDDGFTQTYVIRAVSGAEPPFTVGEVLDIGATRQGEVAMVETMAPPLIPGH